MYCKNCGNKVENDIKFCSKCGQAQTTFNTQENIINGNLTPAKDLKNGEKLRGLGGWLGVVMLALFYNAFIYISAVSSSIKMFTDGTVEKLSSIQGYAGALSFEIVMQSLILLLIVYLIYLFFKKNKKFPKFYIILLIAIVIFIVIDNSMISLLNFPTEEIKNAMQGPIQDGYTQLGKAVIAGIIWIWYMKVSKRVKLTFIEK